MSRYVSQASRAVWVATEVFSVITEIFGPVLLHKFCVATGFGAGPRFGSEKDLLVS